MSNKPVTVSSSNNISAIQNKTSYSIIPPINFYYIEENVSRCHLPLTKVNTQFFQSISIECIINVSGKKLDSSFVSNCEEMGIIIINMLQDIDIVAMKNISKFRDWIVLCVDMILKQSAKFITMIVGSSDNYYDCIILACLRRFQKWSYVAIIGELRHNVWPNKLLDYEQFIEQFNIDLINKDISMPEYIVIHENFKVEELSLLNRCANHNDSNNNNNIDQIGKNTINDNKDCNQQEDIIITNKSIIDDDVINGINAIDILDENKKIVNTNNALHYLHKHSECDCNQINNSDSNNNNNSGNMIQFESDNAIVSSSVNHNNNQENTTDSCISTDQIKVDSMLKNLFFSLPNEIISDGITFDPIISLINEKDEED